MSRLPTSSRKSVAMTNDFAVAVRSLLLPIAPALESDYHKFVASYLDRSGIPEPDQAKWLEVALRRWRSDASPPKILREIVKRSLYESGRSPVTFMFENASNDPRLLNAAKKASTKYFNAHHGLMKRHLLSDGDARQVLSYAAMMSRWAVVERMSASEISRVLAVKDGRADLNWKVVQTVLSMTGCSPDLSLKELQDIYDRDTLQEPELFVDLSLTESLDLIAQQAVRLGASARIQEWLHDLFGDNLHAPYLALLHYQLATAERYDHAVSYPYEFQPRGDKGTWLVDVYVKAGIPVKKSAVLNNAKATMSLNAAWALHRKDFRGANAVANILGEVEALGALAKTELSARLRGILHRYLRVTKEKNGPLPFELQSLSTGEVSKLFARVGNENSRTEGIVEQRLVDCYGLSRHASGVWKQLGLGDSVNATNVSRRKLGDIEFACADQSNPSIEALEAHGGKLTDLYVKDHLDTFCEVLAMRLEDLESIAPIVDWSFTVTFVAHEFGGGISGGYDVDIGSSQPVRVIVKLVSFKDALSALANHAAVDALLNDYFIKPLNDPYVHWKYRKRVQDLSS